MVSKIHLEMLKALVVEGLSWMTRLFNIVWESGAVRKEWQTAVVVPLFKKGDQRVCANYRGIALHSLHEKVYSKVQERRVLPLVESWIEEEQYRFHPFHEKLTTFSLSQVVWIWRRLMAGLPGRYCEMAAVIWSEAVTTNPEVGVVSIFLAISWTRSQRGLVSTKAVTSHQLCLWFSLTGSWEVVVGGEGCIEALCRWCGCDGIIGLWPSTLTGPVHSWVLNSWDEDQHL